MRQKRFSTWEEAHIAALQYAVDTKHDVALRKVKEYGRTGFNISLACTNDSDYARAEIVRPIEAMLVEVIVETITTGRKP